LPSRSVQTEERGKILPIVPIRNIVPFPFADLQVAFGRPKSTEALLTAFEKDKLILAVAQKDAQKEDPDLNDLYEYGVICQIDHVIQVDGMVHALFKGLQKAKIEEVTSREPFLQARVIVVPEITETDEEMKVLADHLARELKKAFNLGKSFDPMVLMRLSSGLPVSELVNHVAASLDAPTEEKQKILETFSVKAQIKAVTEKLMHEINVLNLDQSIEKKTKAKFDRHMKRAVLEERKKEIEKELKKVGGGEEEEVNETSELEKKLKEANLPPEVKKKADYEFKRLAKMSSMSPEFSYIHGYLDWIASMPWNKKTPNHTSFEQAAKILDKDHYGLEDIKERILEYLAVMKLRQQRGEKNGKKDEAKDSNILCFIGPPGVGKTSIGRSIAKALGRKFARVSLGGIRDEAELRGHRRTYVGALPGRIIQGIKNAEVKNPVFMLDEVDKIGADFRGDPSAALLEALDPEQNKEFSDHYLEVPFDLSNVFFILTGNVYDTIPPALLDRLEIIPFSSYTEEEKFNILKKYLIPKQLTRHSLTEKDVFFSDVIIKEIISRYSREAGVREAERIVASICRKAAKRIASGKKFSKKLETKTLRRFLGPAKFSHQIKNEKDEAGVSTGLAWTQSGGEILSIEVALMPGKGRLTLTGHLGEVMKESCQAALSYVRSHWKEIGIKDKNFIQNTDFHIHVPEGATPKDGPSAGTAIVTALISALTKRLVKKDVGMTGEITLRGKVLEIGGVKEKVLAAHRAGIKTIILPKANRKDLYNLSPKVRKQLNFIFVEKLDQVFKTALA